MYFPEGFFLGSDNLSLLCFKPALFCSRSMERICDFEVHNCTYSLVSSHVLLSMHSFSPEVILIGTLGIHHVKLEVGCRPMTDHVYLCQGAQHHWCSPIMTQLNVLLVLERAEGNESGLQVNGKRRCCISKGEDNGFSTQVHLTPWWSPGLYNCHLLKVFCGYIPRGPTASQISSKTVNVN